MSRLMDGHAGLRKCAAVGTRNRADSVEGCGGGSTAGAMATSSGGRASSRPKDIPVYAEMRHAVSCSAAADDGKVATSPQDRQSPWWVSTAGALFVLVMLLAGCASAPPPDMGPVDLVDSVDVERYLGRWYEIARYQSRFERNIYGATAEYSLRDDGRIRVVNSGFKGSLDGEYKEVRAVAWVPDPKVPAALKVRFFPLIASDYLIIGLDQEEYRWAVVGNDSRDFLWFLSRTHEIDEELYASMEDIARRQGFDVKALYRVPQKPRE